LLRTPLPRKGQAGSGKRPFAGPPAGASRQAPRWRRPLGDAPALGARGACSEKLDKVARADDRELRSDHLSEMAIAGHEEVCVGLDRKRQEVIVSRVRRTSRRRRVVVGMFCQLTDRPNSRLYFWLGEIPSEFRPAQHLLELFQQCWRNDRGVVVDHAVDDLSAYTRWCDQPGDQNTGIENDAHLPAGLACCVQLGIGQLGRCVLVEIAALADPVE
jgi:hypothetical protein